MVPSNSPRESRDQRTARLAVAQATKARADRRRRRIVVAVVTLAVLALAIPTALVILDARRDQAAVADAAADPIEGEVTEEVGSADHVTGDVPDDQVVTVETDDGRLPPLGGDHDPTVQNCGFYSEPIRDENAVHSMEHGAVWVTYRPDLDGTEVDRLRELTAENPYLLVSPYEDLAAPVVATAWGVQLEMDSVSDERLPPFLERYLQGDQTPEPNAPCSGGIGG